MNGSLDIIIVNWNAGQQLRECLQSITAVDRSGFELQRVVVVDNASVDGSLDGLENLRLPLTLIRNNENRGFAAACNQGARGSKADYLLFLNPDTRLFNESLKIPLKFMELSNNQDVGIVGIQLIDNTGRISRTCSHFPSIRHFFFQMLGLSYLFPCRFSGHLMTKWDHTTNAEVDHVMGAFFLVRRLLFKALQGFDERFFVYLEDVDFSYRAKGVGWRSYYLTDAQAFHKGRGTSEQVRAKRLFYSLRSRVLYGYKHFGRCGGTALLLGTLLIEPLSRLTLAAIRRSGRDMAETLQAYRMFLGAMPSMLHKSEGG